MRKTGILYLVIGLLTIAINQVPAQAEGKRMTADEYIRQFRDAAVADMKKTGVPASITLAQGMYESDYGNSPLAKEANNHFGIKCHKEWSGPTYHQDDDARDECFRKYAEVKESYDDHSYFLRSRVRYSFLFNLEITDYKGWAHGLKKAGYATNPVYASKLIELIERYHLDELDKKGENLPVTENKIKEPEQEIKAEKKPAPGADNPTGALANPAKSQPAYSSSTTINKVPFVRAVKGDTWIKISKENNLELWQVLEFNDAQKNDVLKLGEVVYVKTKKNRSTVESHTVKQGETMRTISQLYGVKMNKLYRMNKLSEDKELRAGEVLKLNKTFFLGIAL